MATSTLQLEFSQAMADFKKMFPDIDREVIEAVLRANLGAVDQTIDQLLAMSTDNQSLINLNDSDKDLRRNASVVGSQQTEQLIDTTDGVGSNTRTESAVASANSTTLLNTAVASPNHHNTGASPKQRPLGASNKLNTSSNSNTPTKRSHMVTLSNSSTPRRWNPPMLGALPQGFLRVTPVAGQQDFELPDEQFALMLQNEEFMNQLRWNQDFMNALEKEQSGKAKGEDDAAFKERLKNMGKMSRKKFLQMARVFTWQRNKKVTTAKQIDSLPLREEPSDDEDHHHHNQRQQQNAQQSQQQHQGQLQLRK
ncbi:CUE domain-containing protein 1 isoform X2 [Scaptodrosophila lebanonensis]|uniref:CUE domain-containing protein 1 isoform X2 n=1 Tax=Drosophila lebanonensis TaxID=7225 RepID=A0A6J2T9G1_DROLE|nr:CUE domain-containing protein 1 isoform X2 [Scaptodrosophila lebanonensis]